MPLLQSGYVEDDFHVLLLYLLDLGVHVPVERLGLGLALPKIGFEPRGAGLGGPETDSMGPATDD